MSCNNSELEKLCHGETEHEKVLNKAREEEDGDEEEEEMVRMKQSKPIKKRKRHHKHYHQKLEMLKKFCEEVVNKMLSLQEDLHNKILQDMVKRDNEKLVRYEAWKKQDMERFERESQFRAHQHAIAGDRHTKLIHFLNSLSTSNTQNPNLDCDQVQNPSSISNRNPLLTSSSTESRSSDKNPVKESPNGRDGGDDLGKRWPKDQVLALINLRCSVVMSGGHGQQDKELLGSKGPLWERISLGMMEMGYKRSAKRCKEKWENINKYFRKTKDNNVHKKRSIDSRTCPYFHKLDTLYSQGKLVMPPPPPAMDTLPPPLENPLSGSSDTVLAQPPVDGSTEIL